MKTTKYARKPFYVDVPEPVSEENMAEMAEWCKGEIRTEGSGPNARKYIKVHVHMPLKERQTKAFIGDYILFAGNGFKVYTKKAFDKSFEKVHKLNKREAVKAGITPPIEKKTSGIPKQMRPKTGVLRAVVTTEDGTKLDEALKPVRPKTVYTDNPVVRSDFMSENELTDAEVDRLDAMVQEAENGPTVTTTPELVDRINRETEAAKVDDQKSAEELLNDLVNE